jgi:Spy/CpxP family protein refolding chaperone
MIRKLMFATLILAGVALAQPPQPPPPGNGPQHHLFRDTHEKGGGEHGLLPPGRWWKNAEAVKNIGLDDGQVQKIEQSFQESRLKLVDLHANLQKEEFRLEPLLEADAPEESAVLGAIDRIAAARAALEKANAQMAFSIRRVLTPEQWKKLRASRPKHEGFPPPADGPRHQMMMKHGQDGGMMMNHGENGGMMKPGEDCPMMHGAVAEAPQPPPAQ